MKLKKRKKLGRMLLGFLLVLSMILGLVPGMGLTVYALAGYSINIAASEHGEVKVQPEKEWYRDGDVVTLTVTPESGYQLKDFSITTPKNITTLDELVTMMGNAVFTDNIGNSCKIKDGIFCIYDTNNTIKYKLDTIYDFYGYGNSYRVETDPYGESDCEFKIENGKIISISIIETTIPTYSLKGTSEKSVPTVEVKKETVKEGEEYKITMPESNVNVSATFTEIKKDEQKNDKKEEQKSEKTEAPSSYKNEWVKGQWYDANGKTGYKPQGQWKKNSTGWWYVDEAGWYPTNMWQKIDGKWYFFGDIGYMVTNAYAGKWSPYSEGYWWVGEDGAWDGSEPGVWRLSGTKWWFKDSTGWYAKGKSYNIGGNDYEFDADGWWIEK